MFVCLLKFFVFSSFFLFFLFWWLCHFFFSFFFSLVSLELVLALKHACLARGRRLRGGGAEVSCLFVSSIGQYSEEEEEEDEELESSSSETRRVRAQFSDPPRRSGRAGAKSTSAKLASKASAPPKARGRPRAVQIEYDSNEEDEEDDEDARPRKGRLPRQNPSRNRKQVKRGATEKELQELLGDDEDEDDMEEDGGKRDNRSKRKIQEDDEEVDLDDLSVFSKLGGAGGERRAEALLDRREENGERQYFVKWQGRSYLHCSWASEKELLAVKGGKMRLQKFDKRFDSGLIVKGEADEVFPADYLEVDRIIEGRTNGKDVEYLVKWQALGYDCCTWEKVSLCFSRRKKKPPLLHQKGF